MQNWYEETVLRESTGIPRGLLNTHIAKKHEDLFIKPGNELGYIYKQGVKEDTYNRIFGGTGVSYSTETKEQ